MTTEEQKLVVCEKLPELIEIGRDMIPRWRHHIHGIGIEPVKWPTEGLQVCHEAEKLFTVNQIEDYWEILSDVAARDFPDKHYGWFLCLPHEQRLEALCRVWFPEKFKV